MIIFFSIEATVCFALCKSIIYELCWYIGTVVKKAVKYSASLKNKN